MDAADGPQRHERELGIAAAIPSALSGADWWPTEVLQLCRVNSLTIPEPEMTTDGGGHRDRSGLSRRSKDLFGRTYGAGYDVAPDG